MVSIRPEQVVFASDEEASHVGVWKAEVTNRGFMGDVVEYEVRVGDQIIKVRSAPEVSHSRGDQVLIRFPEDSSSLMSA